MKIRSLLPILIIGICGVIAYSNTFDVPFQFDDISNIQADPLIQRTEFLFAPSTFCSRVDPQSMDAYICTVFKRRYITYLSFAADYAVHGPDVRGYHIVNLGIHSLNGLLVYFLVMLTLKTPFLKESLLSKQGKSLAILTSLLFVSHPIQTEAITYITQRLASLATLFYLLSLVCYVKTRLSASTMAHRCLYTLSLVSAVLAMKTKEIAFTLPVIIAIWEFAFFQGTMRTRLRHLLALLLTSLIIPLEMISIHKPLHEILNEISSASRVQTTMSRMDYLLTQFPVVLTYVRLIFLPVNQNLDYDFPVYHSFLVPRVYGSLVVLGAIFGLGVYLWRRSRNGEPSLRLISIGIVWFFVTLSVESGLVPIVDVIFEHRLYLSSVGAFLAIASGAVLVKEKLALKWKSGGKTFSVICAVIIISLTGLTLKRNTVWQDGFTLWTDVIKKSPLKGRGYNNLGGYFKEKGQYGEAIDLFQKALERDPKELRASFNLGLIYLDFRQFNNAAVQFSKALEINPKAAYIYNNRGNVYGELKQYGKAIEDYSQAIALHPYDADYYFNRGVTRVKTKQYGEAIADLSEAIKLNPEHSSAFLQRGLTTYLVSGDLAPALQDLKWACQLGNRMGCEFLGSALKEGKERGGTKVQ
ncbi:MAG: tetratricopeptide repeat protein [Thermodesulfovibrionales bacterium]